MVTGKTATTLEYGIFKLETVSCGDCRFLREDTEKGEGYICLAHAHRSIDPKGEKECQRFLKKTHKRRVTPVKLESPIRGKDDVFDTKPLYELISGNGS